MKKLSLFLTILFFSSVLSFGQDGIYLAQNGVAVFKSDAVLEVIKAESKSLRGAVNPLTREVAFSININSFQGFNSSIQRQHFLEDYMEQHNFPTATFIGKLIEDIPFDKPGSYPVRAKGQLTIHGISKERIIRGTITVIPGAAQLATNFSVPLADHGITIPKIVTQKIAEQIDVNINVEFVQGSKL
jgi:hypothetical protein